MLTGLHVKNMALIDREEVSFGEGLNILSGETGAGKSILIGSVNVALAAEGFKDYVADETKDALVELLFETADPRVKELLDEAGIATFAAPEGEAEGRVVQEPEKTQIILSRKYHNGRSVFRVNQESVTAGFVKELCARLIDIHGQHEHQSLLRPAHHLYLLDQYAGQALGNLPEQCEAAFAAWRHAVKELESASLDEQERLKSADLLRFEIGEIEEAALEPGEDERLEEAYRRMANGAKIMESLAQADALTGSGSGSASEQIGRASRALLQVADYDAPLQALSEQLAVVEDLLQDFTRSLSGYMDDFTYDEQSFYETGRRLDAINHLKSKYGGSIGQVLAYLEESRQKLDKLEHYEEYVASLRVKRDQSLAQLMAISDRISQVRKERAVCLQEEISRALQDLNFPQVKFAIAFSPLETPTARGTDGVCFMLSANPGMPLRPLQDTASGGELSRIMLAIKSVMCEQDEVETLIFDEIDTGISGRTAQKVAEKMHTIAGKHQVICITHLPQIAAMADVHFLIEKKVERETGSDPQAAGADRTRTHIRQLTERERVDELSRILGGAKITQAVRESALEMLQLAQETKSPEKEK